MKKIITCILMLAILLSLVSCLDGKKTNDGFLNNEFGKYPQSRVVDESIIEELKKITTTNAQGYLEYNDNEYLAYKENYYLVEPIKWIELNINDNVYYVTEKIIDQEVFMSDKWFSPNLFSYVEKPNVPEKTHANNYKYSDLRQWLNANFMSTAFSSSELKKIKQVNVDNSLVSTTDKENPYICENTQDYLFVLSCYEASFLKTGPALPTDYAIARGVKPHASDKVDVEFNGYATSWLRTPSSFYSYCVSCTNYDGITYRYTDCYYEKVGVRPAFIKK